MGLGRVAAVVGKGLVAGAVGTGAMTVSSTIEQKAPGPGADHGAGRRRDQGASGGAVDDEAEARFGDLVHWAYATGWSVARGFIAVADVRGAPAAGLHLAAVWGSALVVLPRLEVAPPMGEWGAKEARDRPRSPHVVRDRDQPGLRPAGSGVIAPPQAVSGLDGVREAP